MRARTLFIPHSSQLSEAAVFRRLRTTDQKVSGSNPLGRALDNQALTPILSTRRKSVFATGVPLLKRKVGHLVPRRAAWVKMIGPSL